MYTHRLNTTYNNRQWNKNILPNFSEKDVEFLLPEIRVESRVLHKICSKTTRFFEKLYKTLYSTHE